MELTFAYIDIFFAVIILVATIRCVVRGFIAEFMSMAAVILGILAAVLFSAQAAKLLDKWFTASPWNQLIAFLVLFLVVYLIIKILQNALHNIFDKLNLERLDKALGLFLGLVEGVLAVAVLLFIAGWLESIFQIPLSSFTQKSFFAMLLNPLILPVTAAFRK